MTTPILPLSGFIALQVVVLIAAIVCYVHNRYIFYYAAMYSPVVVFAAVVGLGGGDDWLAALIGQALLSVGYNGHISSSKRDAD